MIKFQSYYHDNVASTDAAQGLLADIAADPMAGWYQLPTNFDQSELRHIKDLAQKINQHSDYLVCIGIGGSYLGHRAIAEALEPKSQTKLLYAGNSLSSTALQKVLDQIKDADFSINVISKSGTTTEPAIAFRILKQKLFEKYGEMEAARRIVATTDAAHGALHAEAVANGYERLVVPDNIGGRYSVLSAVGLLPLAVAGVNIDELLAGAAIQAKDTAAILKYATFRQQLQKSGHDTEVLATFEPELHYFAEWWKQLFGESEGKDNQGIFPASAIYSTDLHSLGQFMQDGRPNLFETILNFQSPAASPEIIIPTSVDNKDQLNYLAGETLEYVNHQALLATIKAHATHLPVIELQVPALSAQSLGALIYFFELACAVSAKLQGVNPFDQPGVEAYKQEMFRLLGKPTE